MTHYEKLRVEIKSPDVSFTQHAIENLALAISVNSTAELVEVPVTEHTLGDAVTLGHLVVAIAAGTIPVLAQILYDWYKETFAQPIEITVTKGNRTISMKIADNDLEYAAELTRKIEKLLEMN